MQHESLSESQLKLLRPVDPNTLKVEDSVYPRSGNLFKVEATPGPSGDVATRNHVGNICMHRACWLKLAPLFWLEGRPVYPGDKLYWADHTTYGSLEVSNICPDWVIGNTASGSIRLRERFLSWNEVRWLEDQLLREGDKVYQKGIEDELRVHGFEDNDMIIVNHPHQLVGIHINCLTRTKPEPEVLVEGQPVVVGETLYVAKDPSNSGSVVYVQNGYVYITAPYGEIGIKPEHLTRTDPTILFEVDGKPVRSGDTVWTLSGDEVTVKRMEHGKVITSPSDWCCCTVFDKEWLSLTPIQRIVVDGEPVDQADLLYFRESGEEFRVYRQVRDVLEDCKGRKAYAHQLTYSDPKQELVEVPIWVNCYDDGTTGFARFARNRHPEPSSLLGEVEGTIKVPKHIADKLKR